jgi:hypothetical protein
MPGFNFRSIDRGWPIPPLAPITATLLLLAVVVENCRATAEIGFWNLENILRYVGVGAVRRVGE